MPDGNILLQHAAAAASDVFPAAQGRQNLDLNRGAGRADIRLEQRDFRTFIVQLEYRELDRLRLKIGDQPMRTFFQDLFDRLAEIAKHAPFGDVCRLKKKDQL